MSTSTAIGMVSESLRTLLINEMMISSNFNVTVLGPDEESTYDRRINLFLYKVQENPVLKNQDWEVKRGSPTQLVPPPLSLNLFYLMTPYYHPNDPETGNAPAHELLGEAMRVFYENPIVPENYLSEGLKDAKEQVKIMLNTLDMEELSRVWNTFTNSFRLSVVYEVSVVQLDMLPEHLRTMAPRVREIGTPQVCAPYLPPVLERIEPTGGTPGSQVTVYGKHLAGWKAYVTMMGKSIPEVPDLAEDSFQLTLPADLLPGFYEIRVDISHLCRQTFYFEVTNGA